MTIVTQNNRYEKCSSGKELDLLGEEANLSTQQKSLRPERIGRLGCRTDVLRPYWGLRGSSRLHKDCRRDCVADVVFPDWPLCSRVVHAAEPLLRMSTAPRCAGGTLENSVLLGTVLTPWPPYCPISPRARLRPDEGRPCQVFRLFSASLMQQPPNQPARVKP